MIYLQCLLDSCNVFARLVEQMCGVGYTVQNLAWHKGQKSHKVMTEGSVTTI